MNENLKNFEYYIFFKIIKERIYIKNKNHLNIIQFQKRCALLQLLTNVIIQMKTNILKEKLKKLLIKKFIYKVLNKHKENYFNKNNSIIDKKNNNVPSAIDLIKIKKENLNKYFLNSYFILFIKRAKICINNTNLKNIFNNYTNEKKYNQIQNYFHELKEYKNNKFSIYEKMLLYKIFFHEIKIIIIKKANNINKKNELNNTKKLFILKMNFHIFISKCKSNIKNINGINQLKQKKENYESNTKIIEIKNIIRKKYFTKFIHRTKIIKQTNDILKRKIFNLIKNNAKFSKDLNYYLNEANKIE